MSQQDQESGDQMRVDPGRAKVLVENLEQVAKRVDSVRGSRKVCEPVRTDYLHVEMDEEELTVKGRSASSPFRS